MPANRHHFTESLVRSLPNTGSQTEYTDADVTSLKLVVGKRRRTYFAHTSHKGRRKQVKLGTVEAVPLKQARAEAAALARQMAADGVITQTRSDLTLRDGLELLRAASIAKGIAQRTQSEYERTINLYLADWLDVPLRSITPALLRKRHRDITERRPLPKGVGMKQHERQGTRSPSAANMMLTVFKRVYNLAANEDQTLPRNPAGAVVRNATKRKQEVAASEADFAAVAEAIVAVQNPIRRLYYWTKLYTGLRGSDLRSAERIHIDATSQRLCVPMPKRRELYWIPLSNQLIAYLDQLPVTSSPYLFPANSKSGHIAEDKDPSLPFKPHDLRRLYRTAGFAAGVSKERVELLMHHRTDADVTHIYLSEAWRYLAQDQQRISDWLDAACGNTVDT